MDTYNTDTQEIDLWYYLQLIYRNRLYIIAFLIFGLISSYFFSSFIIQKEYQSEMGIQLNSYFLNEEKEIPLDYILVYLNYPEVISATMAEEGYALSNYKNSLILKKINNIVQISFKYHNKKEIDQILKKWVSSMQLKLILDVGNTRLSILQDDKLSLQVELDLMESKYKNIKNLLEQEGQYVSIEVLAKDLSSITPFVYKELNPSYTELNEQANQLKIKINELSDRQRLLDQIEKDFKLVQDEIRHIFNSKNLDLNEVLSKLRLLEMNYSVYYKDKANSSNCALIPFQVISDPSTKAKPVYPNVSLNTAMAGFIGLCIGIFFIVFLDYIKCQKENDKESNI